MVLAHPWSSPLCFPRGCLALDFGIQDFRAWRYQHSTSTSCSTGGPKPLLQQGGDESHSPEHPEVGEGLFSGGNGPQHPPLSQLAIPSEPCAHPCLIRGSPVDTMKDFCGMNRFSWVLPGRHRDWMVSPPCHHSYSCNPQPEVPRCLPQTLPTPYLWSSDTLIPALITSQFALRLPARSYLVVKRLHLCRRGFAADVHQYFHLPSGTHLWRYCCKVDGCRRAPGSPYVRHLDRLTVSAWGSVPPDI